MREEVLIAIVMLAVSAFGSIWKKNDKRYASLFMFIASVAGCLVAGMGIRFREIVEGPFGFLDSALSVACATLFVYMLYSAGVFDKLFDRICSMKDGIPKSFAVLMFIALPAAFTGFAGASVATTGALAGKKMKESGVQPKKVVAAVASASFIGMVLPPNCIPAMIAANGAGSVLPTPYVGFFLPLLICALPALVLAAFMFRKAYCAVGETSSCQKSKVQTLNLAVLGLVVICVLVEGLLGSFVYIGGNVLFFTIASILLIAVNRGFGSFRKCIDNVTEGLMMAVTPIALMFVLGSFIEVSTMSGVRGIFSLKILPYTEKAVMLVLMVVSLVVGLFLAHPLAAFIITYAVYPIGWLANAVIVAGCAMALAAVDMITFRGGTLEGVSGSLGIEMKNREAFAQVAPVVALTLAMGFVMVVCGDSLTALIL